MKVLKSIAILVILLYCNIAKAQSVETFPLVTNNQLAYAETLESREEAINCLASNIYYEARGEPEKGKVAVAVVTINRAKDDRWPDNICSVVKQDKQFSWYRPGMIVRISHANNALFLKIKALASRLYDKYYIHNTPDDVTYGATHFHATYVTVKWRAQRTTRIGKHIFFRIK